MFFHRPLVSDDMRAWIDENDAWVDSHAPTWRGVDLVTPTKRFFKAPRGDDHATALAVLEDLKRLLDLRGPIDLQPLEVLPEALQHSYGKLSEVGGQYFHDPERPLITYDPRLMRTPVAFINTLTHELIHMRLAPYVDALPGGEGAHELATDLHCIIAGFGLFQLEAAEIMGWAGYLSQPARAVALARFLERTQTPNNAALSYVSKRPARWLRKALKDRARHP